MNLEIISVFFIFLFYFLFFKKFQILNEDKKISIHKNFVKNKQSPILIGGIFIITIIIFFSDFVFFPIKFSLLLIFLLGLTSDKNILPNPKIRIIIQFLILMYLINFYDLKISDLRIDTINIILSNFVINLFFTTFCIAILVNGSNFIDGLNGLLIGYSILVLGSIFIVTYNFEDFNLIDKNFIIILIFSLFLLFIINISGLVYLGDSGSYLLSFFLGVYLIIFFMDNKSISPYYIASILWYPAFENFFSLVRRLKSNKNVSTADNFHLHQLVYSFLINTKKINKKEFINSLSGIIILLFNIPGLALSSFFPYNTKIQILIIFLNVTLYLFFYFFLSKKFNYKQS